MSLLYKSTASQVVMLKLFLSSDHVTAATGKTVAITISKNGGAFGNPNVGATIATEVSNGWYKVTLDATDTNTEGDLVVRGTATSCDDTERVFRVHLPANFGSTSIDANGRVDVIKVNGTSQTARDLGAQLDAAVSTRLASASVPTNFSALSITVGGVVSASVATGGITSTSFAAGAIDAAAIAADAIGSSELAQSAAQEIADEILNRDLVGGSSVSSRNVRNALRALRNKQDISAGTLTVYQEDDLTSAWTATVTTAAGNPIVTIDPA